MSRISTIVGTTVKDSRGEETVLCTVTLASGSTASASVPRGKSVGSHEAVSVPAEIAVSVIKTQIFPRLIGLDSGNQKEIDTILCELGGEQKKEIGGNTTLVVSIAVARAHAQEIGIPLWRYLRDSSHIDTFPSLFPRPFVNVINGGAHTGNTKLFQEYIVVPQEDSVDACLSSAEHILKEVGKEIQTLYPETPRGDEGGYALQTQNPLEPFLLLQKHSGDNVFFALDAAATDSIYTDEERTTLFVEMSNTFPLRFLEDPYGEESFSLFSTLQEMLPNVVVVGDDLTTTNITRIARAHAERSITGVIIKPNQIGTVSEALEAVRTARGYGWTVVASHRSGETDDTFIADFAYGVGADGIKIGAPVQPERKVKYDRLRAIEKELTP
ncbi:MAG: hypothetical protein NUW02_02205 [Candidatus Campbellbacteria bacterium]|nr:hypothetical protein [Candidatus Campbellbacteria bacterium]